MTILALLTVVMLRPPGRVHAQAAPPAAERPRAAAVDFLFFSPFRDNAANRDLLVGGGMAAPIAPASEAPATTAGGTFTWGDPAASSDPTQAYWTNGANWSGGTAPAPGADTDVVFNSGSNPINGSTVDTDYTINSLSFQTGAPAFAIGSANNATLTINAGGVTDSSVNAQTLTVPIVLGANQPWNVASANGSLQVQSTISGGSGLTKTGLGTLTFNGGNTYTGLTSVTGGTLVLNTATGLGISGDLSIGNATNPGAAGSVAVLLGNEDEIGGNTNLTIYSDGILDMDSSRAGFTMNNDSAAINNLTMTGGEIHLPGETEKLSLHSITTNASASSALLVTSRDSGDTEDNIYLNKSTVTANVARGTATYDLDVQAALTTGTLVKDGAGVMRLAGNTNEAFSVTLNAGTLALASDTSLGYTGYSNFVPSTFTVAGGTVTADGGDRAIADPVSLTGNATIGASLDGTPRAISFTGTTTLTGSQTLTVNNTAATTLAGVDLNGANTLTLLGTGNTTISGVVTDEGKGGGLTMSGTGTLTLSGTNTYTGSTTIDGGRVSVSSTANLGNDADPTTNVVAFGGTGGELLATANLTLGRYVTYNAGAVGTISATPGTTLTFDQSVNVSAGANLAFGSAGETGTILLNPNYGGNYNYVNSSLPIALAINAGTLRFGTNTFSGTSVGIAALVVSVTDTQTIAAGATLDLNGNASLQGLGYNVALNDLLGAGNLLTGGNASSLVGIGAGNFSGVISGPGSIEKGITRDLNDNSHSPGTLTLTGANTYTGTTAVDLGTLAIATGGAISNNSALSVAAGGTLQISGGNVSTGTADLFVGTAGDPDYGTAISTPSAVALSAGSLTSTNQHIGYLQGSVATFTQTGGTNTVTGALLLGQAGTGTYELEGGGTLNAAQVAGGAGTSTFNFNGGTLQAGASDNPGAATNPTTFFSGLTNANVRNGGAIIDTNGYNVTIAQALVHSTISGDNATDGGLTKIGTGTLTLTGADTYTGNTTVSAGTLAITAGSVGMSGLQNAFNVDGSAAASATATLSGSATVNAGGLSVGIGGSGNFTQSGGTLTLPTVGNGLFLGVNAGSSGTYTMTGGQFNDPGAIIGNYGTGSFVQSGGVHDDQGQLYLGNLSGGNGSYTLSGTGQLSAALLVVGSFGPGLFTQTGGTVSAALFLGVGVGSALGTYNLSDGSLISAGETYLGEGSTGTGIFNQSGNSTFATPLLIFTDTNGSAHGTYNLNGGVLNVNVISNGAAGTGSTSTFNFNGGTLQANASDDPVAVNDPTTFFSGLTTANVRNGGAVIDTNGYNVTIAQALVHSTISGDNTTDGGLTKMGAGMLTLSGANTYTGATTISAGTLLAGNTAGSATGAAAVTVQRGATLGGNGTIAGAVTVQSGGTLAPGTAAVSRLTLDSTLALQSGSTLAITLGGTQSGSYDQVFVGSELTLEGTLHVSTVNGFTLTPGETFTILDDTGNAPTAGLFTNAVGPLYTDPAGDTFQINYLASSDGGLVPNDVTLTYLGAGTVPEPSTWAMLVFAGIGLLGGPLRRVFACDELYPAKRPFQPAKGGAT